MLSCGTGVSPVPFHRHRVFGHLHRFFQVAKKSSFLQLPANHSSHALLPSNATNPGGIYHDHELLVHESSPAVHPLPLSDETAATLLQVYERHQQSREHVDDSDKKPEEKSGKKIWGLNMV